MKLRRTVTAVLLGVALCGFLAIRRTIANPSPADELPSVIKSGLEAYKSQGPEAAIKAWMKGSALEGSKDALSQANILRQVQDYYGSYESFDVVSTNNITQNTHIVYFTMNFQKGPVFAKFLVFHSADGWVTVNFTFNTKAEMILPNS